MKTNPINIYFDNTIFALQNIGGISIVFGELISRLESEPKLRVNLIVSGDADGNIIYASFSKGVNKVNESIKFPKFALPFMPVFKRLPAGSIYHTTYNRYSFQKNIHKILTIHDLGYEKGIMRKGIKRLVHLYFKKIAIKKADAIICVSENTHKDLKFFYGDIINTKVVRIVYNGIADAFLQSEIVSTVFKKNILYVGGRQAYKNFESVVAAVEQLTNYNLVIAGGGELLPDHKNLLNAHLPNRYIHSANLSTQDLIKLYQQAFCLVYPSSYEGFGLPIIEAMATGCPVIACDNSCIAEIAGGAAVLIKEPSIQAINDAISMLGNNEIRNKLIHKGKLQAQKFSWNKATAALLNLYIELGNNK